MSKRSAQRHRQERREREGERHLGAMEVKALDKVAEIVERTATGESSQPRFSEPTSIFSRVYRWVLSSMANEPGERASVRVWDAWYRDIVQQEPFLAGIFNGVVQTDVNRGYSITGGSRQVKTFTEVVKGFDRWIKVGNKYVKGNTGGWRAYSSWQSQSYWATRMGFVSEIGRQGRGGPLFTLWSVDPTRCELVGDPAVPLKYYPSSGGTQEWAYDKFIRKCSLISTDETKLGYGFPAVARCYQLAKIMVGVLLHYQQKLGTKTPDGILTGKFIGETEWKTALQARDESLQAKSDSYLNSIATIMSSGGDMPEFALTLLSSLPDRWDIDLWVKILMRGYETAFGYKGEFTYENAGVLGRGNEVEVMHRNATAMGGRDYILAHQGELQELLPPTIGFLYDERDVEGEIQDVQLELSKAQVISEMAKWAVNGQNVLSAPQIMTLAAEQGVIPEEWTPQPEDTTATDEEDVDETVPVELSERVWRAVRAFPNEQIVRYSWPSGKTRILRNVRRSVFYIPKARRFNPHHEPAGSSEGGQFASSGDGKTNNPVNGSGIKSWTNKDYQDASAWGFDSYSDWANELTDDESRAIREYSGYDFEDINDQLRLGIDMNKGYTIEKIDSALSKTSSPIDFISHRLANQRFYSDLNVGDTYTDKGFVSTSLMKDHVPMGFDKDFSIHIRIPKGTKGAFIDMISKARGETEFLLPRNTSFRVISKSGKEMTVEVVNQ